ncbi:MAG TPA: FKBP-type peptidyl-prolyl cis-trans isomerase, partial [Methylophilaceae bacterium]|nr:FKBP-type peptidyl-prolyl cis-trans isomerase [Methylophilaceae bacterium]
MKHTSVFAGALLIAFFAGGCTAESPTSTQESAAMNEKVTELKKIDQTVGSGREAEPGLNVTVHYTGWLYDSTKADGHGQKFDSSVDRGQPFVFFLGGQ